MRNILVDELKYKLQIIKSEILNLKLAIDWAKVGVKGDKENINYKNVEESLDFVEIRIASSNNSFIYIIDIPTTYRDTCNRISIKHVKIYRIATKVEYDKILVCDEKSFGIKGPCKNLSKLTVCKNENIEDITKTECLTQFNTQ